MLDQRRLAGTVSLKHSSDLRKGHMAFIQYDQKIIGKEIDQTKGAFTCLTAAEPTGVIFNAAAEPQFLQLFQIVIGAHADALCFQKKSLRFEISNPLFQLAPYAVDRSLQFVGGCQVLIGRIEVEMGEASLCITGQGIQLPNRIDLIPPELYSDGRFHVSGKDIHHVASYAEVPPRQAHIVAIVLIVHQSVQQGVAPHLLPYPDGNHEVLEIFRRTQSINAGNTGYHQHVPSTDQ